MEDHLKQSLKTPLIYSISARIRVEGGTLILQSAENKNISFQTQGSGLVNINGEDLSRIISG